METERPYDRKNYEEAKKKGRCSPFQWSRYNSFGWDMTEISSSESKQEKPRKDKGKADFILDENYGRC